MVVRLRGVERVLQSRLARCLETSQSCVDPVTSTIAL